MDGMGDGEGTWADVHCIHPCKLPRNRRLVDEPIGGRREDTVPQLGPPWDTLSGLETRLSVQTLHWHWKPLPEEA
jgi:hypothetical protein